MSKYVKKEDRELLELDISGIDQKTPQYRDQYEEIEDMTSLMNIINKH